MLNGVPQNVGDTVACEKIAATECILGPNPSPSPSPSPSPIPLPENSACDSTSLCESGTGCSCMGFCKKVYTLRIDSVGDDSVTPYICGNALGAPSGDFITPGTWGYTGPCTDVFYRVPNVGGSVGMMSVVSNDNVTFAPTTLGGGLYIIDPPKEDFLTDPAYDFSSWTVTGTAGWSQKRYTAWSAIPEHQDAKQWTSGSPDLIGLQWFRQRTTILLKLNRPQPGGGST